MFYYIESYHTTLLYSN